MKTAGLIYGEDSHYLDHLGVLCKILSIPLIVTDEKIREKAKRYYPNLQVIYFDPLEAPSKAVISFDLIFSCLPRLLFDKIFFFSQALHKKKIATIWVPHGNSDKGRNSAYMEGLGGEEIQLVYGPQMVDFLKQKEVLKKFVLMGNFRYRFYKRHQSFYSSLVQKELAPILKLKNQKVLLYAPTWQDQEKSSSFVAAAPILLKNLPQDYALVVKPHPHLLKQEGELIRELEAEYKDRSNVLFLNDFPPIYPLLAHMDIYIGDMSSIGYDFLTFDRPLFFLSGHSYFLTQAGTVIEKEDYPSIYEKIREGKNRSHKQLIDYVFGTSKSFKALKSEIANIALGCN